METDMDENGTSLFDALIFKRELNEVYLLLDHISGKQDSHIWDLDVSDIPPDPDSSKKDVNAPDPLQGVNKQERAFWLYFRISQMRYPPNKSAAIKAYDATLLLYVKDRLNAIADPAKGLTIGYTYLYLSAAKPAGARQAIELPRRFGSRAAAESPEAEIPTEVEKGPSETTPQGGYECLEVGTRADVARSAFPGLEESALELKKKRYKIFVGGAWTLFFAVLLYCWTVYGSMLLKRFEDDRKSASEAESSVYAQAATDGLTVNNGESDNGENISKICCWDYLGHLSTNTLKLCGTWSYYQARYDKAIADAGALSVYLKALYPLLPSAGVSPTEGSPQCPDATPERINKFNEKRRIAAVASSLAATTAPAAGSGAAPSDLTATNHAVVARPSTAAASSEVAESASLARAASSVASDSDSASSASAAYSTSDVGPSKFRQEDVQTVGILIAVCVTCILPILFGFIGTVAAFLRDISNKARTSTLTPRDESLAYPRVLLGGIAGIAVGLFYDPNQSAQQIATGGGVMSLSAPGIAFLAGYAADSFFTFLDAVSARVFSLSSGTTSK